MLHRRGRETSHTPPYQTSCCPEILPGLSGILSKSPEDRYQLLGIGPQRGSCCEKDFMPDYLSTEPLHHAHPNPVFSPWVSPLWLLAFRRAARNRNPAKSEEKEDNAPYQKPPMFPSTATSRSFAHTAVISPFLWLSPTGHWDMVVGRD